MKVRMKGRLAYLLRRELREFADLEVSFVGGERVDTHLMVEFGFLL